MDEFVTNFGNKRVETIYLDDNLLYKSLKKLENKACRLVSLEEKAKLRIKQGRNSFISEIDTFVQEGVIYIPYKGRFITKISPVLENPKEATEFSIKYSLRNIPKYREFPISNEQAEKSLENSVQVPYKYNHYDKGIPTTKFGEEEITDFLFGRVAKDYGLFLKDLGHKKAILVMNSKESVDRNELPFANQLSFYEAKPYEDNGICYLIKGEDNRYLGRESRVLGILKKSANILSRI